jgi:hypothetical protein
MLTILERRNSSAATSNCSRSLDSRKSSTCLTNKELSTEFNQSGLTKLAALTHLMLTSLISRRTWVVSTEMMTKGQANNYMRKNGIWGLVLVLSGFTVLVSLMLRMAKA